MLSSLDYRKSLKNTFCQWCVAPLRGMPLTKRIFQAYKQTRELSRSMPQGAVLQLKQEKSIV